MGLLPKKTPEGYLVAIAKFVDSNPSHFDIFQQIKLLDMFYWLWVKDIGLMEGAYIVFDMKGTVLGHVPRINLMAVKKYLFYIQVGFFCFK